MDNKLQDALYKKYPKIFVQRHLNITQSCMPWGICCGDGWYPLLNTLCALIQHRCDCKELNCQQVEASQVKEKFGTLRFYVNGGDDMISAYIGFAEYMSGTICEVCGATLGVEQTKGWISTLCKPCLEKHKKNQIEQQKKYKELDKKEKAKKGKKANAKA